MTTLELAKKILSYERGQTMAGISGLDLENLARAVVEADAVIREWHKLMNSGAPFEPHPWTGSAGHWLKTHSELHKSPEDDGC